MIYEENFQWFTAEGVPITPYDDSLAPNTYPLMRITARSSDGEKVLASTDIVLPVSDEMDCLQCHSSGSTTGAEPPSGWENHPHPDLDQRWNILRLHDDLQSDNPVFQDALSQAGYLPGGLYATAKAGTPILCAHCHGSNALPGTGIPGIPQLTQAIHSLHANVTDPVTGLILDSSTNRASCYRCHPGEETRCLRGAMGNAIAADGSFAMQCQSCHGNMSTVGASTRAGWFDEPTCQSCHTGTATLNNGQIRYLSSFEPNGEVRQAVNNLFATNPNTPAEGFSLYRFSTGHGGLQCSACHGSTHAVFPSHEPNDNIANIAHQGDAGTLALCTACHKEMPETNTGGPHGMHPIGEYWVDYHKDAVDEAGGPESCRACHGLDYRGTELSRVLVSTTFSTKFGTHDFWRGRQIGCYDCHNGPHDDDRNHNSAPIAAMISDQTPAGMPLTLALDGQDPDEDPLTFRIVRQPRHGRVALSGNQATFFPDTGFSGVSSFQYAARDHSTDSNLATVQINIEVVDSDEDGLYDWWETLHFGDPTIASASGNPDGDSFNNLEEQIAGTDPNKASSRFRLVLGTPTDPMTSLGIVTKPGRLYQLESSTNLANWNTVATDIPGRKLVFPISVSNNITSGSTFFRAAIQR
jgi:hypothetical protein